jgi:hypothetical protein
VVLRGGLPATTRFLKTKEKAEMRMKLAIGAGSIMSAQNMEMRTYQLARIRQWAHQLHS